MSARILWARCKREALDALEVLLLPAMAAWLPWSVCYRLFRRASRWTWLYRESVDQAWQQALARHWGTDEKLWKLERRLVTLVDHCDHYLSRTRSDAWMQRHLDVRGAWPQPAQAALCLTFHWGAGMWGLRHAHAHGQTGHMLVASVDAAHFKGRSLFYRYILARNGSIAHALGRPSVDVSRDTRAIVRALKAGEQVFAVIDVPADQGPHAVDVMVAGLPARLPRPLLRMAAERALPVYVYITGFDVATGQRWLDIREFGVSDNADALAQRLCAVLTEFIAKQPSAWHFWSEAPRFFVARAKDGVA